MRTRLLTFALAVAFGCASASPSGEELSQEADSTESFVLARQALEDRNFERALKHLRVVEAEVPNDPAVLWNTGIALAALGRDADALTYWERYRAVAPDDWRGLAKQVQAHQALGQLEARDRVRSEIFELRESDASSFEKQPAYCREQTFYNGYQVLGFEVFDPGGEWMVFYSFHFIDDSGNEEYRISFGSYDFTTDITRELGEIGPEERVYHLDRYEEQGHTTLGFFDRHLTYDEVRKLVLKDPP